MIYRGCGFKSKDDGPEFSGLGGKEGTPGQSAPCLVADTLVPFHAVLVFWQTFIRGQ